MRRALRNNSLSIITFGLFALFLVGMSAAGVRQYNEEQTEHGEQGVSYVKYLQTGAFVEATFENWESEFLQMGGFVLLTVWLRQKGSPESKKLDGEEPVDEDPEDAGRDDAPWLAQTGGVKTWLYGRSLSIALFALFFLSFALHAAGGSREYSAEQLAHGGETVGTLAYLKTSQFWFESFQNWQSEFLAVGALVVLSIYLRQKGSPESKPVAAPHAETGSE
ncbi:MAG TPA: DUF6766 family protein [Acidimicrobiales bacterium]|nr:DUF6766 family protein [Acidimicrobiales bacterium]